MRVAAKNRVEKDALGWRLRCASWSAPQDKTPQTEEAAVILDDRQRAAIGETHERRHRVLERRLSVRRERACKVWRQVVWRGEFRRHGPKVTRRRVVLLAHA